MDLGGQDAGGVGDLGRDVLGGPFLDRREQPCQRADPADPLETSPELGLEDDHEGEHADDGARLEDLAQERQVEQSGGRIDRDEDADADDETYRPGPADEAGTASR